MMFQIAAAVAVIAALGAVPASANEVAAGTDEPVSTEVTVAANDLREATAAPVSTAVPLPYRRPKSLRIAPPAAARPVAVSSRDWNCSDVWCGRHFVLMLGVGY
jgi:hypothetical protein